MTKFSERLQQAAKHVGAGETQAEIAADLGLKRQTVNHWFRKGAPEAENLALIEKRWGVNGEWLRSGDGEMLPQPSTDGLSSDERELVKDYRRASPKVREVISTIVRAARKSMVAICLSIPPLMAPNEADAGMLHNSFSATCFRNMHCILRWLRSLLRPDLLTV